MDLPAEVQITNELLGIKGGKGQLVAINPTGYYELILLFGGNRHRVLLPITGTALVFRQPEAEISAEFEVER